MITSTPSGLFCEAGNFHLDPWEPVERAVVTHAWEELATLRLESRVRGVEGFILKRRAAEYGVGRRKGAWWGFPACSGGAPTSRQPRRTHWRP